MTNDTNSPKQNPSETGEDTMPEENKNEMMKEGQDAQRPDPDMADCRQRMLTSLYNAAMSPELEAKRTHLQALHILAQAEKLEAEASVAESDARKREAEAQRTYAETERTRAEAERAYAETARTRADAKCREAEARLVNAQAAEAEGKKVFPNPSLDDESSQEEQGGEQPSAEKLGGDTPCGKYSTQDQPDDEALRHDFHCAAAGYSTDVDVSAVIAAARSQLDEAIKGKTMVYPYEIRRVRDLLQSLLGAIKKQDKEESEE